MDKLNILYITDNVGLGGGETSLVDHLVNLNKDRYCPVVVCPDEGELTAELVRCGIRVEIVHFTLVKRYASAFVKYPLDVTYELFKRLKREQINIVNANGFNCMLIIAPAVRMSNVPLVWTCHGWWPSGKITGMFINIFADKIIAVSGYVKNKLINEGNVKRSKIVHIPLGIDLARYNDIRSDNCLRQEFNLDLESPIVGMIGRFQRLKGHMTFVIMASEICKRYPQMKFLMVGGEVFGDRAEYEYGEEVREYIHDLRLENNIVVTGFRRDIPRILGCLDVLVVPSEVETFGMVILEAMAAGVPVISCARGGPREIIKNGGNGFIIDGQDSKQLAEKVLQVIESPSLMLDIIVNGKNTVRELYQIKDQVGKIESLYLELMGLRDNENFNG